jgi:hypothetical protein
MAISEIDMKLLWGRAAGMCSEPGCGEDLTVLVEGGTYVVGEMAHIIGRKPSAQRGKPEGGSDSYENLILLCPTHHTHIDKAPEGKYSEDLLHEWKRLHEQKIRNAGTKVRFSSFEELRQAISRILASNRCFIRGVWPKEPYGTE